MSEYIPRHKDLVPENTQYNCLTPPSLWFSNHDCEKHFKFSSQDLKGKPRGPGADLAAFSLIFQLHVCELRSKQHEENEAGKC
jgi:hypothetical protein